MQCIFLYMYEYSNVFSSLTSLHLLVQKEREETVAPEKPQVEDTDDPSPLEAQLKHAKQEVENMKADLKTMQQELAEVRQNCESHEKELERKAKEIKLLKRELDAEVKVREETAKENAQLEIAVGTLKSRHEREVKAKIKEISELKKKLMECQSSRNNEEKPK